VPAGAWYAAPVAWAAEQEIVRGTSATGFSPLEPVTREQFAALLCRYARWSGAAGTEAGEDASPGADEEAPPEDGIPEALRPFPDAAEVSPYARAAMAWAVETGLLRGEPHGGALHLRPQKTATRSQAAALLMRYCVGE
ncbi:MAG: S-layer homology domain-containing protein, partial [Oscillospiraceae bacterium]|nr:S-layer homology domain-containing protein [Oscillospiraceae bacterium]